MKYGRLAFILAAPMLLVSCLLTPGKFISTLDNKSDGGFTFTYAGEVIMLDPAANTTSGTSDSGKDGDESKDGEEEAEAAPVKPAAPAVETSERIAERKATAQMLAKEAGYRSVEYIGNNKFRVDYALSGKLDRGFVYPINTDVAAVVPWIAIEIRRDGTARVKAIAFGQNDSSMMGEGNPMTDASQERQGSFTLTTDAELVMHNNEDGLVPGPRKKIVWNVTPTSKIIPTAVLRFTK